MVVEDKQGKLDRAYARVIVDFSSAWIKPIFTEDIDQKAHVVTDGRPAHKAL